jgi:hypothetical protein
MEPLLCGVYVDWGSFSRSFAGERWVGEMAILPDSDGKPRNPTIPQAVLLWSGLRGKSRELVHYYPPGKTRNDDL